MRNLPCQGSALPLSYAPFKPVRLVRMGSYIGKRLGWQGNVEPAAARPG